MPFRQLLDRAVAPARGASRQLFLPVAVPVVTTTAVTSLFHLRLLEQFAQIGSDSVADFAQVIGALSGLVGLTVLMLAIQFLVWGALTVTVMDAVAGRPASVARGWRVVLRPASLVTVVLVAVLSVASLLACLLPALVVWPLLGLALPAMAEEGLSGWAAIRRSVELARYNPLRRLTTTPGLQVAAVLLVTWLITQALALVVQGPFLIAQQVWILRGSAQGGGDPASLAGELVWLQVPMTVLGSLVSVFGWLYCVFALALLYHDVRRRKEGDDLEQAIASALTEPAAER